MVNLRTGWAIEYLVAVTGGLGYPDANLDSLSLVAGQVPYSDFTCPVTAFIRTWVRLTSA